MNNTMTILRRELQSYFSTPLAYIFLAVFLGLTSLMTFKVGHFFESGQDNLEGFFQWHPWLYLFLVPAVSMRLWAEERKSGTIELLFTLPVSLGQAVVAKFLAGWILLGIALILTFPIAITAAVLGDPDNGQIMTGYIGSFLLAGGFLAIGCCISALTRNQVISFVVTVVVCFAFMFSNLPMIQDFFAGGPGWLTDAVNAMSFFSHFDSISRGVIQATDAVYFVSMMLAWLLATSVVLEYKKAQ